MDKLGNVDLRVSLALHRPARIAGALERRKPGANWTIVSVSANRSASRFRGPVALYRSSTHTTALRRCNGSLGYTRRRRSLEVMLAPALRPERTAAAGVRLRSLRPHAWCGSTGPHLRHRRSRRCAAARLSAFRRSAANGSSTLAIPAKVGIEGPAHQCIHRQFSLSPPSATRGRVLQPNQFLIQGSLLFDYSTRDGAIHCAKHVSKAETGSRRIKR